MLLNSQSNEPLDFTQGDDVELGLIATDNDGNPVVLTDATLTTQILGMNGEGPITIPNGQHTIADQDTNPGEFSIALTSDNTSACAQGIAKQIITQAVISAEVTYFRGNNLLTVYVNEPLQ